MKTETIKIIPAEEAVQAVREFVEKSGGANHAAGAAGVALVTVYDTLKGIRQPSEKLLNAVGMKRIQVVVKASAV